MTSHGAAHTITTSTLSSTAASQGLPWLQGSEERAASMTPTPRTPTRPSLAASLQAKDRQLVQQRMRAHVQNPESTPLLIFPEGTCVNNEYCVMFKRGAFDLGQWSSCLPSCPHFGGAAAPHTDCPALQQAPQRACSQAASD